MALRGVLFTIDALIATILMVGLMITITTLTSESSQSGGSNAVEDLTIALSAIDVNESTDPEIATLIANGTISPSQYDLNLLELIAELWAFDDLTSAGAVTESVLAPLGPRFDPELLINGEVIRAGSDIGQSVTRSARLVSGINKSAPVRGFSANLFLTGAQRRTTNQYHYFDGLTGMGNLTMRVYLPENATVFSISMEADAGADFDLLLNSNDCGSYNAGDTSDYEAEAYTIIESASCNFSTIFSDGLNTLEVKFTEGDFADHYIAGGFVRIRYLSDTENTYLRQTMGGEVRERIYFNGANELANIFSSFSFPGNLTNITAQIHFDNQATINEFYVRFADKTIYRTNETGERTITLSNSTITSYLTLESMSGTTVPIRIGHFDSSSYNDTNSQADAMLTIESSTTMETCDFPYEGDFSSDCDATDTYISRLEAARNASQTFAYSFLNLSGNRMGLVDYHATVPPGQIEPLTDDLVLILDEIEKTVGNTAPLCFTCAIAAAAGELRSDSSPARKRAILLMSDGATNRCYYGNPNCNPLGGLTQEEKALDEAVDEACDIWSADRITIYTVGYGLGADNEGLARISEGCTNGIHFNATNLSSLIDIYLNISSEIQSLTYEEQIPVLEGNISSELFADSYIEATYVPFYEPVFGELTIGGETATFTNNGTTGALPLTNKDDLIEANVLSYSGAKWTNITTINGEVFYDVSDYGENITTIGDPFRILIPGPPFESGPNPVTVSLSNATFASPTNRITYRLRFDNRVSAYSSVLEKGDGCHWTAQQEDLDNLTISIPKDYTGVKQCYYTNATYDPSDAYDVSAYTLFRQLDLDDDGLIDILLADQDLTIESTIIDDVPSLWGPAVFEVRLTR